MRRTLIAILAIAAGGCATVVPAERTVPRQAVFNEAEYAPYAEQGTASISGQAFLMTRGGDVKPCAGKNVYLEPRTAYSAEWFNTSILRNQTMADADPRADKYTRRAIADADGRFRFDGLPAGDYILLCFVSWEVPGYGGLQTTGGPAYAVASLSEGASVEVVMTDQGWTSLEGH